MKRIVSITALAVILVMGSWAWRRLTERPDPLPGFPRLVLWAWEQPEDLRFVKGETAGIAFLAKTVWLDQHHVVSRPRLQPLRFTPGTPLMAVVRLESDGHGLPPRAEVIREILPAATIAGVSAVQIDFDARASERAWYRALLIELRAALPASMPLTITALASWCEADSWIRDLPVADAVPMLFRMGSPGERVRSMDFHVPLCQSSIGVATDELPERVPGGRRLYFFYPRAWTPQAYEAVVAQAGRWR
jgi:hypothetical protein